MKRFAIGIQYLGTPYAGFARTFGRSKQTALSLGEQIALNKGILENRGDDLPSFKSYIEASKPTLGVLDVVEDALAKMCGEKGRYANLKSSSRTDAGVHGLRNIIHVDIEHSSLCDPLTIRKSLNYYLESRKTFVLVTDVTQMPDTFDARIDATARSYLYKILLPRLPLPTYCEENGADPSSVYLSPLNNIFHFWSLFHHNRAWVLDPLPHNVNFDMQQIQEAARFLIGEHDFASFQSARCQSSTSIRELFTIQVFHNKKAVNKDSNRNEGNRLISNKSPLIDLLPLSYPNQNGTQYCGGNISNIFSLTEPSVEEIDILITGDSFLQRMVRNIVGLLVQVGLGKNSVESVQNILAKKDRNAVIISPAPAHGLYLLDVHYDKERRKVKEQRIVERYQYSSPQ